MKNFLSVILLLRLLPPLGAAQPSPQNPRFKHDLDSIYAVDQTWRGMLFDPHQRHRPDSLARALAVTRESRPTYIPGQMLDRQLMRDGKAQVYGTQAFGYNVLNPKTGQREAQPPFGWPIRDAAGVNERRQKAGFKTTVEENATNLRIQCRIVALQNIEKMPKNQPPRYSARRERRILANDFTQSTTMDYNERFGQIEALLADLLRRMDRQAGQIDDIINILKISDERQTHADERQDAMLTEIKAQGQRLDSMLTTQMQMLELMSRQATRTDELEQRIPAIAAYESRVRRLEDAVFNKAS